MIRFTLTAVATLALTASLMNSASAGDLNFSFGQQPSCKSGNGPTSPAASLNLGPLSLSFGQQASCNGGNCRSQLPTTVRPNGPSSCGSAPTPGCSNSLPQALGPQGSMLRQPTISGRPPVQPRASFTAPNGMSLTIRSRR